MATHRIIEAVLLDGQPVAKYTGYAVRAAAAASEAELKALDAERKIEAVYCALWLEKHVGETFDASISSLTGFGLFAELDNTCEGFIPIGDLPGVYLFDAENMVMTGGRIAFRLGDPIRIKVEEVEPMAARVRFSLVL